MCSAVAVPEIYQAGEVTTTHACPHCGTPFVPRDRKQVTCGAKLCRSRRCDVLKRLRHRRDPELVRRNRERCARWGQRVRGVKSRNPWLVGQPPYYGHMPGRGFLLELSNGRVIRHEHIRGLHGLMSELLSRETHPEMAWWSLLPVRRGCGWSAFVREPEATELLQHSSSVRAVRLFDHDLQLRLSHPWRARYPEVPRRGHRQLRIDTITPVVMRAEGGTVPRPIPSRTGILSSLTYSLIHRIGVEVDPDDIMLDVLSHDTRVERTWLGDKQGTLTGWLGSVVVDTNAIGEFLLRCAARGPGLGGRVAYGFGRVVVSESAG